MICIGFQFGVGVALATPLIWAAFAISDYLETWTERKYQQYKRNKLLKGEE